MVQAVPDPANTFMRFPGGCETHPCEGRYPHINTARWLWSLSCDEVSLLKSWQVKSSPKQDCSTNSSVRLTLARPHPGTPAPYWKATTCAAIEPFRETQSSSGPRWERDCPKNDRSRPVNTLEISCHYFGWEIATKYQICVSAIFHFCLCLYHIRVFSEEGSVGNYP